MKRRCGLDSISVVPFKSLMEICESLLFDMLKEVFCQYVIPASVGLFTELRGINDLMGSAS